MWISGEISPVVPSLVTLELLIRSAGVHSSKCCGHCLGCFPVSVLNSMLFVFNDKDGQRFREQMTEKAKCGCGDCNPRDRVIRAAIR